MKKIIVICEPQEKAGGIESIYQLVDCINNISDNGYVFYRRPYIGDPQPDVYKKYNIKIINELPTNTGDLIVVPEVWTDIVNTLKGVQKCIWWLSVDNNRNTYTNFADDNVLHLYQSEYAKQFLLKQNCKLVLPMHDYIHTEGFNTSNITKHNNVCYNPAKGKEITDTIIKWCGDINFIPIINMTRSQIIDTINSTKIYIDFGHHPGRDRIPREAALCNNIVVTSFKGSAKYKEDINIPEKYKLKTATPEIKDFLKEIINNYNQYITDFREYKLDILKQPDTMKQEAYELLKFINKL